MDLGGGNACAYGRASGQDLPWVCHFFFKAHSPEKQRSASGTDKLTTIRFVGK